MTIVIPTWILWSIGIKALRDVVDWTPYPHGEEPRVVQQARKILKSV